MMMLSMVIIQKGDALMITCSSDRWMISVTFVSREPTAMSLISTSELWAGNEPIKGVSAPIEVDQSSVCIFKVRPRDKVRVKSEAFVVAFVWIESDGGSWWSGRLNDIVFVDVWKCWGGGNDCLVTTRRFLTLKCVWNEDLVVKKVSRFVKMAHKNPQVA